MNGYRTLEEVLPDVMAGQPTAIDADEAVARILTATQRLGQQPRWLALLKEPPLRLASEVVVGSPPARLGALAVVVALLVVAGAVAVGAMLIRPPRPSVPPPFGPARNGDLFFDADGSIFRTDAAGTASTAIVSTGVDGLQWFEEPAVSRRYPTLSRDGTHLIFERISDSWGHSLMLASIDGKEVRPLTGEVASLDCYDWSPDGTQVAVLMRARDGSRSIGLIDLVGLGTSRALNLGDVVPTGWVVWRPPNGAELIFAGRGGGGADGVALYRVEPEGGTVERITSPVTPAGSDTPTYASGQLSPDGSMISYWTWGPDHAGVVGGWGHVLNLATGEDRLATTWGGSMSPFSPDGRWIAGEGANRLVIAPVDGTAPSREVGPPLEGRDQGFDWSPDGRTIVLTLGSPGQTWLIDVASGVGTPAAQPMPNLPSWQRIAP